MCFILLLYDKIQIFIITSHKISQLRTQHFVSAKGKHFFSFTTVWSHQLNAGQCVVTQNGAVIGCAAVDDHNGVPHGNRRVEPHKSGKHRGAGGILVLAVGLIAQVHLLGA